MTANGSFLAEGKYEARNIKNNMSERKKII